MEENKENNTSIIHNGSNNLVRAENLLNLSNKIIFKGIEAFFNEAFCLINKIDAGNNLENFCFLLEYNSDYHNFIIPHPFKRDVYDVNIENTEKAIVLLQKFIRINPTFKFAYLYCSVANIIIANYELAIIDCNKAIKTDPYYDNAYDCRGIAKGLLSDYDGAISDYTKAIEINPKYVNYYFNRGLAKNDIKDYAGAVNDYNKLIEINPNYIDAYYRRGKAKMNNSEYESAIDDFKNAIEINPNYANVYCSLNHAKFSSPNFFKGDCYFLKGLCKYYLNDYIGSVDDFSMAIEKGGGHIFCNRKFYEYKIIAKRKLGDIDGAEIAEAEFETIKKLRHEFFRRI